MSAPLALRAVAVPDPISVTLPKASEWLLLIVPNVLFQQARSDQAQRLRELPRRASGALIPNWVSYRRSERVV